MSIKISSITYLYIHTILYFKLSRTEETIFRANYTIKKKNYDKISIQIKNKNPCTTNAS